jgi:ABC-type sugar transport system ATPase subunit
MSETPILEVRGARKSFGAIQALDGVDLSVHPGEVIALLGDNGAGKSTLVKAIAGVHRLDTGTILLDGRPATVRSPADSRRLGIEVVYQDLAVFDNLSARANLFAGRELCTPRWMGRLGFLHERAMLQKWDEHITDLDVNVPDPTQSLGVMSGGQRQAVAVARAAAFAQRIVILDEPTAALGVRESAAVLKLITALPSKGVAVLVVSHNLEHVMQVADRAVVLRRGRNVGEAIPRPTNHEHLVSLIVGGQPAGI